MAVVRESETVEKLRNEFLHMHSGRYFNAGMMLINVPAWEAKEITEKCFTYRGKPKSMFWGHDQDILNIVLDGDYTDVPRRFNYLGGPSTGDVPDIIVYHYFGRIKPWQIVLNEYDRLWWDYNQKSLWAMPRRTYPSLEPDYYFIYKQLGKDLWQQKLYGKSIRCYLIYSFLKVCKVLKNVFAPAKY